MAAKALSEDWNRELDGKQVQRWSQALGRQALASQNAAVLAMQEGRQPWLRTRRRSTVGISTSAFSTRRAGLAESPVTARRFIADAACRSTGIHAGIHGTGVVENNSDKAVVP